MKKFISLILIVVIALSVTGCKAREPIETQKKYTLTKGVNLSALEDIFKPYNFLHTEKTYSEIAKKGFDHVRLPVDFRNYCDKEGNITDSFYKNLDKFINMANRNGLIVILDFHGWYDFNVGRGDNVLFKKIWKNLAEHYKNHSTESLFFELINEPHTTEGGDLDAQTLWNLQNEAIGEIREIDPLRTIVIAMPEWNGVWTLKDYKDYGYDNLIIALHTYEPLDFTHQGEAWAGKGDVKLKLTDKMLKSLTKQLEDIASFKERTGLRVILNEFGLNTTGYIKDQDVSDYIVTVVEYTKEHDIPWTYWAYSGSFGVYDIGFLGFGEGWRQNVIDALMR